MMNDEREQSEFNDALGYLSRLNSLFYLSDDYAISLNAHSWFHTLLALERELSTEMKPEEITKFETQQNEINNLIGNQIRQSQGAPTQSISPELYSKLHTFELSLRKIFKDARLQNKMKENAGGALK